jgi:hypothetical protein
MAPWVKRVRGVVGMGVTWAVGWAVGGLCIGVSSLLLPWLPWNVFFELFDAPLPALAVPGFFAGLLFAGVFSVAARGTPLTAISLPRMTAWGALGGALLSLVPATMVSVGLATINPSGRGQWELTAAIAGPLMFFSALSATLSLLMARRASRRATALPDQYDAYDLPRVNHDARALSPSSTSPSARSPSRTAPTHASPWPPRK